MGAVVAAGVVSAAASCMPVVLIITAAATASQKVAQAMTTKAVESGKVSAADVAQITFDAIRDGQFYIYSHPGALAGVQTRMEEIVGIRNPGDPYKNTPQVRDMLREKMKAAK